jgi:predicted Fe-Mo cluster-binding NifX family protein
MTIAVAATGPSATDRICRQFAWCHCFVLVDEETGQRLGHWSVSSEGKADVGKEVVQRLLALGVGVVVAGQFCGRTRAVLEAAGIICQERLGRMKSLMAKRVVERR